MSKATKKYLNECKRTFPFISKNEKLFFKRLADNLDDTSEEITYEDICQQFGDPKTVMTSYIENCDNSYIIKRTSLKSITKFMFIILFCIMVLTSSVLIYYNYSMYKAHEDSNIIKQKTIIVEEQQ